MRWLIVIIIALWLCYFSMVAVIVVINNNLRHHTEVLIRDRDYANTQYLVLKAEIQILDLKIDSELNNAEKIDKIKKIKQLLND